MNIKSIKNEKDKIICEIELESNEWSEIILKEKKKAAKNVKIPGFRKGKVPESEAIKHVNIGSILTTSAEKAVNNAIKELENNEKLKKIDVEVFPRPSVEIGDKFDEKEFAFNVIYWIVPKVTIDNYKKLNIKLEATKVTDKDVEQEIDRILAREKMLNKKESGKIEKGDQATFDFVGSVDGKEFPGGKAEKFELEIGSGQFIPGFEDQMIGMSVGEEKDINVTFPKEYHAKELAGKPAVFKVKIHEVNTISKPELNEEIIKSLNLPDKNVKTPEQFKKFLKENMEKFHEQRAYETNIPLINKAIYENAKYDPIPEVMILEEKSEIERQFNLRLEQMNMKLNDFLEKIANKTKDQLDKELYDQAKQNCVVYGALDYIIDKEKIKIDDNVLQERYESLAQAYNKKIDEVKKMINRELLEETLLHEKALLEILKWNQK